MYNCIIPNREVFGFLLSQISLKSSKLDCLSSWNSCNFCKSNSIQQKSLGTWCCKWIWLEKNKIKKKESFLDIGLDKLCRKSKLQISNWKQIWSLGRQSLFPITNYHWKFLILFHKCFQKFVWLNVLNILIIYKWYIRVTLYHNDKNHFTYIYIHK